MANKKEIMKSISEVEQEAAEWIVRADRPGALEADGKFEAWLASDARHRSAYLKLAARWSSAERLRAYRPVGSDPDPQLLTKAYQVERRRLPLPYAIGASMMLVLLSAGWAWWMVAPTTYRTQVGGYERVVLPDGSVLHLNTDTKLAVQLTRQHRRVTLVRGEAFFEVAHDASRPFDVLAGDTLIRAVGTAFTVRDQQSGGVEVVVTEGRVRLTPRTAAEQQESLSSINSVMAGEVATTSRGETKLHALAFGEAARRLAWQEGELIFDGARLADVVEDFNRYNTRRMVLDDGRLNDVEVGGNFHATDLDAFLRALKASFDIESSQIQSIIHLKAHR